jgi:hypothetical protein
MFWILLLWKLKFPRRYRNATLHNYQENRQENWISVKEDHQDLSPLTGFVYRKISFPTTLKYIYLILMGSIELGYGAKGGRGWGVSWFWPSVKLKLAARWRKGPISRGGNWNFIRICNICNLCPLSVDHLFTHSTSLRYLLMPVWNLKKIRSPCENLFNFFLLLLSSLILWSHVSGWLGSLYGKIITIGETLGGITK